MEINPSDTIWVLVYSALVMLMTPGVALFYGGMVRRKNVLSTLMMSFAVLGLVGFRILWGLVGSHHARFTAFIYKPTTVFAYLKDIVKAHPRRYLGHNPAGGAMVVALLLSLLATTLMGLLVLGGQEFTGPFAQWASSLSHHQVEWLEEGHEWIANFTLLLVFAHLAGVALASLQHRENLVRSMFTGRKEELNHE